MNHPHSPAELAQPRFLCALAMIVLSWCASASAQAGCGDYLMPLGQPHHAASIAGPHDGTPRHASPADLPATPLNMLHPRQTPCDGPQCGTPPANATAGVTIILDVRSPQNPCVAPTTTGSHRNLRAAATFPRPSDHMSDYGTSPWGLLRPPQPHSHAPSA